METVEATTPAAPEVDNSAPLSMDEAVEAYLSRTDGPAARQDAAPPAQEAPEQPAAESDPDTAQADQADVQDVDSQPAPSEEYEFDLAGHKVRLSKENLKDQLPLIQAKAKELEAGSQRKFQEAAEVRKKAEEFAQLVAQNTELVAEYRGVTAELDRLQKLDLEALSDSDPVTAQKALLRMTQLQHRQATLVQGVQQSGQQLQTARAEQRARDVAAVRAYAQSSIKGWSQDLDRSLGDYVVKNAVTPESVERLTADPRLYEMAVKAYKFDTLQAAKPVVEKRATEAPKTLKPNSANQTVTSAQVRARDAWGKFEKSGKLDDAVDAYLARQRARGR